MAELERHQDRESWVSWAIEFVRRGLWPADVITVHGPHASSADHFWGEAEAWDDSGTWSYTFSVPQTDPASVPAVSHGRLERDRVGPRARLVPGFGFAPKVIG